MREKFVKHPGCNWNGFYMSGIEDNIIIVPFGVNIFSYIDVVEKQIKKYAVKKGLNECTIYIDTLHIPSTKENNTHLKLKCSSNQPINWLEYNEIHFNELPLTIKDEILRIYRKYENKIKSSLFSSSKNKFEEIINSDLSVA